MWSVLIVCVGWFAGLVAFGRPHQLKRSACPANEHHGGRLSVIIPARNEEGSLGNLLAGLSRDRLEHSEIIVVDDQSSDATASLAGDVAGVSVLAAGERPEGWTGKSWACHVGAAAASGDVLCFLDADVRLAPGALASVFATHQRLGGLVSVQPWHATVHPYEQLSAIFGVVALMGAGTGAHLHNPCAFGPLLMTSAAAYRSVGGHAAARAEVVEDVALGSLYKADGRSLRGSPRTSPAARRTHRCGVWPPLSCGSPPWALLPSLRGTQRWAPFRLPWGMPLSRRLLSNSG